MSFKIYSYPGNKRVAKATIAAQYVGVKIEEPTFTFGVDNKTPEFIKKNPLGKVPVLETPEGCIFESNAIARYIARQGKDNLYPKDKFQAAQVEQWIDFSVGEIDLPRAAWLFPIFGLCPESAEATKKAKGDISAVLSILNQHLEDKTFLVGERITLADIIVSLALIDLYIKVLDAGFRKAYVNTNRWFLTCVNQPQFKAVLGEVTLCEKMAAAPKAAAPAPAAAAPAKAAEKPKEAPKKAEAAPKKDAEEDDGDDTPKEAKKVSALASLPPSTMVLDEWKKVYSNNDTRPVALDWLWKNFDAQGYCMYFSKYKYPQELKVLFMVCNAVGGFVQRLDELRKYGFGSLCIFGDDKSPNFDIQGVWIFRGQNVPDEMKECYDSEAYDFIKVDLSNPKQKKLVEDFLAWNGDFEGIGKPFNQGKNFK